MTRCPHLDGYAPLSEEQLADPFTIWQAAREHSPVFYASDIGVWTVTRFADVVRILEDPTTFANGGTLGGRRVPAQYRDAFPDGVWSNAALINRDGDNHKKAKVLAQRAFIPSRVNAMRPAMEQLAEELLDPLVARGTGDLMNEFAYPFTIRTITKALGLPSEDAAVVQQVTEDALVILTPGNAEATDDTAFTADQAERFERVIRFREHLGEVIAAKRENPDAGVISALTHATIDGERLSEDDIKGMVLEQLVAGNDTAANAIAHAVYYLSRNPQLWDTVAADPELVPRVVEETVRRHSPSKGLFRRATRDVSLGGADIGQGELIHVLWGSANTDERQFPEPLRMDLGRENIDSHVGFGRGEHRCLGVVLARLECRIAIEAVLRRLKRVRVTEERLRYVPALTNVSLMSLQATWG
ncbi:cytochrome P450 [Pseudonocardia sp. CA-107938]|uniref:cytochrome P450 n=1 Tax=Pseudonocardia sp. CA-107938 TaxID=3240021 RepID=UPI003D8B46B7